MAKDKTLKVRENRLRRMLERRGLQLSRSRRRDPGALDYGRYLVTEGNVVVFGHDNGLNHYSATLEDIEGWLADGAPRGERPRPRHA